MSNRELFFHVDELSYIVDGRQMDYNHYRPYSLLTYMSLGGCIGRLEFFFCQRKKH